LTEPQPTLPDVTHLIGRPQRALEEELFRVYQHAFDRAKDEPTVFHFRAAVAAYDDLIAALREGTDGTHPEH
jgi:hypothetical protein